jgi:hypothetical protein
MDKVGGQTLVLRVVAIAALARLLKRYDERGSATLVAALRRATKRKCEQAALDEADIAAALEYAQGVFEEASVRADRRYS